MSKREQQLFHTALLLVPAVLVSLTLPAVAQTEETNWRLLRGRDIAPARTGMPRLTIKGQALSGSTGCNSFTSTLTRQSDAKAQIDRPALTRKFCGGKQQDVENAFVDALGQTDFLEQSNDRLTFLSGARQPLLVWQPFAPRARRGRCRAQPANIQALARGRKRQRHKD
jgi:heat shock protein HslJ